MQILGSFDQAPVTKATWESHTVKALPNDFISPLYSNFTNMFSISVNSQCFFFLSNIPGAAVTSIGS